ncbi:MAG: hypothetical protein GX824_00135 [Clostridiales bacterium]|nr:hypothetical protein [Clostridiales bacterium]
MPYILTPQFARFPKFYKKSDTEVPDALLNAEAQAPDLAHFPYPLPSKKSDYNCYANGNGGVVWYGAKTGLTRFDPKAERKEDIVMFFSSDRDLPDNNVHALLAQGDSVWALTDNGVTFMEMRRISMKEKADVLLNETLRCVDRRGMISQKKLSIPGDVNSYVSYGHSDNDGCFTASFAMGELYRYAVLKKEKGENDPEALNARKVATRAVEACLLLMNISGRGDGFVARSYLTTAEPVPDDGLFYRKSGGKAVCLPTKNSKSKNLEGKVIEAGFPVPARLAKLYRDEGFTDDEIIYKGDTSSDEITLHYLMMRYAHDILGEGDTELDSLIKMSAKNTLSHIINHGFELHECDGRPTTWAKWSMDYFESGMGWADAPLNAAEILMYLRVVMHITGEKGKWLEAFNKLIDMGYAELTEKHHDRFWECAMRGGVEIFEDIMFGDHALASSAYWGLISLETDQKLKEKYIKGFKSWRHSIAREHNPFYDMAFKLACPGEEIELDKLASWLYRTNPSRLAAGVSLIGRHDIPVRICLGGSKEVSYRLSPDEMFISKYDRNPFKLRNEDSGGMNCVESCYVFTLAYWMGRYYGFFAEQ